MSLFLTRPKHKLIWKPLECGGGFLKQTNSKQHLRFKLFTNTNTYTNTLFLSLSPSLRYLPSCSLLSCRCLILSLTHVKHKLTIIHTANSCLFLCTQRILYCFYEMYPPSSRVAVARRRTLLFMYPIATDSGPESNELPCPGRMLVGSEPKSATV